MNNVELVPNFGAQTPLEVFEEQMRIINHHNARWERDKIGYPFKNAMLPVDLANDLLKLLKGSE